MRRTSPRVESLCEFIRHSMTSERPSEPTHVHENDQIITCRFDGMPVKAAFSTSCCCTSLQSVNTNLSLSLNVTAQSDIVWHGTQCEALVGTALNVHHVRRWSTRVKRSHTTVVNEACGSSHLLAGHDNWTVRCSSAQGPPDSTTLRGGGSDAQRPTVTEGRQEGEVNEEYFAPRQTTPPATMRPSVLADLV